MAASRWIALLLFVLVARGAGAATIGVAWDPSAEAGVTGYRVFVGRVAGVPSEWFDVGPHQTSFLYRVALPGQRYYFSVATMAGLRISQPSSEISGVAGVPSPGEIWPEPPVDSGAWSAAPFSAPALAAAPPAGAFGEVSQLVTTETGVGLFIESGTSVHLLSRAGIAPDAVLQARPLERFVGLAFDPGFAVNGLVYVAAEVTSPGLAPQLAVTRYRLVGGRFGEAALVVAALPVSSSASIAVSPVGDLLIATGAQVLRVAGDGTVPRGQPAGQLQWAALDGRAAAAAWDQRYDGLWVAIERETGYTVRFFAEGPSGRATREIALAGDRMSRVGLHPSVDGVYASIVNGRDVARVDLERGTTTALPMPALDGALVSWAPGWAGDYIVIDRGSGPATGTQRLMLVASTAPR